MKIRIFLLLGLAICLSRLSAQKQPITYFLPPIGYDAAIPTPENYFGWQIGEWHLSHDQQLAYLRTLDALSPRISIREYGRTHEQRPLVYLVVTSPENHSRLEELRTLHLQFSDPDANRQPDISQVPLVINQGFTIHGNEPSGANAAVLLAYYLAAGNSEEIDRLLQQTIILLDPCLNPDGMQRFSTWANMHKNAHLTSNPADREYREVWPGGRTNHYWFDLNRDWLPVQHPESQGRIRMFHEWRPNILTDHHEMGSNATFFFMPGEPSRVNPLTPAINQQLTERIGRYHAAALDKIGSLYYTKEGFDDFYVGKGSTYPDLQGCVGILFEQASSRGHLQDTENGPLSFAFTIRNQITTALSTQRAAVELREDLLRYQRGYFRDQREAGRKDASMGYVVADDGDPERLSQFAEMLGQHQIAVNQIVGTFSKNGRNYVSGHALFVKLDQPQYALVRAIFESTTTFSDSLFYDISTWTMPLAFNLPYTLVGKGERLTVGASWEKPAPPAAPVASGYAYLLPWEHYYAPKAAYMLMQAGLRLKSAQAAFTAEGRSYAPGTVLVPVWQQGNFSAEQIHRLVRNVVEQTGAAIIAVGTGLSTEGVDLGSGSFETLRLPKVGLVVGDGVSSYDAGEAWHLLDQFFGIPVTKIEGDELARTNLQAFNAIIMVDGSYGSVGAAGASALKGWVQQGNVLIAQQRAAKWCADNGLASLTVRANPSDYAANTRLPYGNISEEAGSKGISGAIFGVEADLSHPLLFGYGRPQLPVFRRGTLFFEPAKNVYATPLLYPENPLLSGYAHANALKTISKSAAAIVCGLRTGRVICLADNPSFRSYWKGGNKLLMNALFLGHTISSSAAESVSN